MGKSDVDPKDDEILRLREALDAETSQLIEVRRQLNRMNEEFEDFVLMAAHDLREPLREIASFSQLMAETSDGRLGSDSSASLERIQDGAARAQSLLTDVLDYWSPGIGQWNSSPTDMEAVLNQALLCLDKQIEERQAIVTHDPLPTVSGDFGILSRVLQHVLRNAVEYCGTASPRVHVSCRRGDHDWILSVQDNGPGIAPEFQRRIFEPFRRLHGKEHPGNGLGLAFCRKAIERHGGRMSMESKPGAGCTFSLTLPAA